MSTKRHVSGKIMSLLTSEQQLLQFYRNAEYHGVGLLQRLSRETDAPQLQIELTKQMADETRHALLWTERICALGGTVVPVQRTHRGPRRSQSDHATIQLDLLAQLYVAEERLQQQYRAHLAQSVQDSQTAEILQAILRDEDWHCGWLKQVLADQTQRCGRTRVAAAIDYFWNAETGAA